MLNFLKLYVLLVRLKGGLHRNFRGAVGFASCPTRNTIGDVQDVSSVLCVHCLADYKILVHQMPKAHEMFRFPSSLPCRRRYEASASLTVGTRWPHDGHGLW
ncbi:hypothetical protein Ahy_A04g018880 isoform A [Arachis hypogaea]|uniref:Uncharacterized protein n=1 Tax=Arachis hypogaea TaxID=3818 RepID=A0A445DES4_ARAHY|nr:hypothetical protein Ahy_A04g018880 isoform A [Arachis hypogaea]